MPRPVDQSLSGVQSAGFGPAPGASENLGSIDVSSIHQLDVDGATENARALAQVFAKAGDVGMKLYDQEQDRQQKQGEADATLGNVDPDLVAKAGAYATGVKRAQTQMQVVQAAAQARAFWEKNQGTMSLHDSTDASGNTVPGLLTSADNIFRKAFPNGEEKDPVAANIIAPVVQHTMNEMVGSYYQTQVRQSQQSAEDAQTGLLTNAIATGAFDKGGLHTQTTTTDESGNTTTTPGTAGLPFHVDQALDTLTKVYGGDQRAARSALAHSVGEAAVQTGRPDIIDTLLPRGIDLGGGATLTPENLAYLDEARNRATVAQNRNNKTALQASEMSIVQQVAHGKDPQAMLDDQYAKLPGAEPGFYKSMVDWYKQSTRESAENALNSTDAFALTSEVALGHLTSAPQIQQWVDAHGYNGGAAIQLMSHAMQTLEATQRVGKDDMQFEATQRRLDELYRPGIDKVTGKFDNPAAVQQHANVLSHFVDYYQQELQQGTTPALAAMNASNKAQNVFGKPIGLDDSAAKVQRTDTPADTAAFLRNRANLNTRSLQGAGITGSTIKQLRDRNLIDSATADAAAAALLKH